MRLRERCRAELSDMVPTQIDRDEERLDCSVADTSPARHRYSPLDIKISPDIDPCYLKLSSLLFSGLAICVSLWMCDI